jgi:3-oxoacyl-[acyl-carrier-protein] synthase II
VIVLSADEASVALLAGYARIPGYLSEGVLVPFGDSGRLYSGASAAVLLEAADLVSEAAPKGRLLGFGFAGDDSGCGNVKQDPSAWSRAMTSAIRAAGLKPDDIDVVVAAAVGRRQIDDLERNAIHAAGLGHIPVSAPKAVLGDTQSTAPLLGIHQSVWMKSRREAPATHHFGTGLPESTSLTGAGPLRVLVNSMEVGGNYQSLIVEVP